MSQVLDWGLGGKVDSYVIVGWWVDEDVLVVVVKRWRLFADKDDVGCWCKDDNDEEDGGGEGDSLWWIDDVAFLSPSTEPGIQPSAAGDVRLASRWTNHRLSWLAATICTISPLWTQISSSLIAV